MSRLDQKRTTGRGQPHATRPPLEQLGAELDLEIANLFGEDGWATRSRVAAALKLRSSATATKYRRWRNSIALC